ncbi:MAG: pectin esterase [Bacteroidales bacterium]|nr:pectin esterase [Bacteroidales bacterium]
MGMTEPARKPTIFMIGDSTMANKSLRSGNEERGWGQALPGFLDGEVRVSNHAKNGRSSKSFIDEGLWAEVEKQMQAGDYLIIQFGHNDEKPKEDRHTDPGSTFDANLRMFAKVAKSKGATPIICNSIVRRNFAKVEDAVGQDDAAGVSKATEVEGKELIDTHGEYVVAPRNVAEADGVIFIDMNKLTHDLVESMGPEKSKELYLWTEAGKVAAYPDGKKDNTHLNIHGARVIAGIAAKELKEKVPSLSEHIIFPDIVVAKDGCGDFFTVQEAVNAIPDYSKNRRTTILIKEGTYKEKVVIPESKMNVTMIGQGNPVITWDDYASKKNKFGDDCSTSGSSTFYVYGNSFEAEGITFENTAGRVGQAVACFVKSDGAKFRKCRFLGNQDTLYTYGESDTQTYEECYIEGTVDFIFGKATAYFDRCEIKSLGGGYVCAPATPEGRKYGYVFNECKLTSGEGVKGVKLARPWRPYAQAVFVNCEMGGHIAAEGWDNWGKKENEKTAFFGEIGSKGEGANAKARAPWARKLKDAKEYSKENVVGQ